MREYEARYSAFMAYPKFNDSLGLDRRNVLLFPCHQFKKHVAQDLHMEFCGGPSTWPLKTCYTQEL
jgi:hypothetical protein